MPTTTTTTKRPTTTALVRRIEGIQDRARRKVGLPPLPKEPKRARGRPKGSKDAAPRQRPLPVKMDADARRSLRELMGLIGARAGRTVTVGETLAAALALAVRAVKEQGAG